MTTFTNTQLEKNVRRPFSWAVVLGIAAVIVTGLTVVTGLAFLAPIPLLALLLPAVLIARRDKRIASEREGTSESGTLQ